MFEFGVLKAQVVTTRQNFHIQCKTNTSFNRQFQGGMEILAGFLGAKHGPRKAFKPQVPTCTNLVVILLCIG